MLIISGIHDILLSSTQISITQLRKCVLRAYIQQKWIDWHQTKTKMITCRHILLISANIRVHFTSGYVSFCSFVCYISIFRLISIQYRNIVESSYFMGILLLTLNGEVVLRWQESPAIADKPARHESMTKIAQIRRAYNVVADNTGLYSYVWLLLRPKSAKSREILWKFKLIEIKVIQGHRSWYQSKAHMYFPISH